MEKIIFDRYIIYSDSSIYNMRTNKIMKVRDNDVLRGKGSLKINLQIAYGIKKTFNLHILMAQSFIEDYDIKNDLITFRDNNPKNCELNNLIIRKNGLIRTLMTDEMNDFFESQNPYGIVIGYIKKKVWGVGFQVHFNNVFKSDDLVQHMITLLHKRTPQYLLKFKDTYTYVNWAFNLFDFQFKHGDIYQEVNKNSSIIKTDLDDSLDAHGSFISSTEAFQMGMSFGNVDVSKYQD